MQYHAALQSEPVDPDWAPAAVDAIRGNLASHDRDWFEIVQLDCRTDLCELHLAGRLGGNADTDMRDLQQVLFPMKQEPWWTALQSDQDTSAIGMAPDGRALLVWFVSRK